MVAKKSKKRDVDPLRSLKSPWENNEHSIWIGSTVRLNRNLENFNFPNKLSVEQKQQLLALLSKALLEVPAFKEGLFLLSEKTAPLDKEFLFERFLAPSSFHQAHSGEAFLIGSSGTLFASLNLSDHLELYLVNCEGDLEQAWNELMKIEIALGKSFNYAFSEKFGFLTSRPAECGTALQVSVFLHMPALVEGGKLQEFLDRHPEPSIHVGSLQGPLNEIIGDLVVVRNNYTLGQTEESILSGVRSYATKLMVSEKSERSKFKTGENSSIKDKISRAYGLLLHSYQISASEALNAIGLIKLGLELEMISGIQLKKLNALFFDARRAHLIYRLEEKELSQEELNRKRAEFIHSFLKGAKLKV